MLEENCLIVLTYWNKKKWNKSVAREQGRVVAPRIKFRLVQTIRSTSIWKHHRSVSVVTIMCNHWFNHTASFLNTDNQYLFKIKISSRLFILKTLFLRILIASLCNPTTYIHTTFINQQRQFCYISAPKICVFKQRRVLKLRSIKNSQIASILL